MEVGEKTSKNQDNISHSQIVQRGWGRVLVAAGRKGGREGEPVQAGEDPGVLGRKGRRVLLRKNYT